MRALTAFGRFCYDLVVGDDYKLAVAAVLALAGTGVLLTATPLPHPLVAVIGGVLVAAGFTVSLLLDVHDGG